MVSLFRGLAVCLWVGSGVAALATLPVLAGLVGLLPDPTVGQLYGMLVAIAAAAIAFSLASLAEMFHRLRHA